MLESRPAGRQNRLWQYAGDGILLISLFLVIIMLVAMASFYPLDNSPFHAADITDTRNLIGYLGAWWAGLTLTLFGYPAFLLPLLLLYAIIAYGYRSFYSGYRPAGVVVAIRLVGTAMLFVSSCTLAALYWSANWLGLPGGSGGWFGAAAGELLVPILGNIGTSLLLVSLLGVAITYSTGISWLLVLDTLGRWAVAALSRLWPLLRAAALRIGSLRLPRRSARKKRVEPPLRSATVATPQQVPQSSVQPPVQPAPQTSSAEAKPNPQSSPQQKPKPKHQPKQKASVTQLPSAGLLQDALEDGVEGFSRDELDSIAEALETHLQNFNVHGCCVVGTQSGPVVTRFELELQPGIKASRVSSIAGDLARSLAVASVRVQENIPGKSYIGIEIPNRNRKVVRLKRLLTSGEFTRQSSPLTLALGDDISGQPVVADLAAMPHLLVAGTTGSGKSVAVNTMLLSLLYKSSPDDVRLILVDPKMLELSLYENIPHLLTPVITDMGEAINAMRWCVMEMERRYKVIAAVGERNLDGYNSRVRQAIQDGEPLLSDDELQQPLEPMARMVVVIDEFADMMMALQGGSKKVETLIARLAQKARAAGIHLMLATQRPSADVITGLIKSNIPARLAFQVSSSVDSRVILDQNGAETLLGYGDALFLPPGSSTPMRVHGAFVDNDEVKKVTRFWTEKGEPEYIEGITQGDPGAGSVPGLTIDAEGGDDDADAVYDEAVEFVIQSRKASISAVQRRFKVGYNRAARLVERMEAEGIVSPPGAMGGREVLASRKPD